ncbi:MAG: hypothetical protein BWY66_01340 [bacterium ADurb.Bin374]|nr:MAG: hypothetical protein BWY66_01340 [bacterium ADurb.Bin374]
MVDEKVVGGLRLFDLVAAHAARHIEHEHDVAGNDVAGVDDFLRSEHHHEEALVVFVGLGRQKIESHSLGGDFILHLEIGCRQLFRPFERHLPVVIVDATRLGRMRGDLDTDNLLLVSDVDHDRDQVEILLLDA